VTKIAPYIAAMDASTPPIDAHARDVLGIASSLRATLRALDARKVDAQRRASERERSALDARVAAWMLRRRKVMKKTLSDSAREELRALFNVLDSDGGGEVEFDEFAEAWSMMAGGDRARDEARNVFFNTIDIDRSGTMDFEEFVKLMNDLEYGNACSGRVANASEMLANASRALQTRKAVNDFITQWTRIGATSASSAAK
jgi:hypothetical protein